MHTPDLYRRIRVLLFKEGLVYPLVVIAGFILVISSLYYKLRFTELGNEMKRLSTELEVNRAVNRNLETEIARLAYLPRIERFARDTCNMEVASEREKIVLYYEGNQEAERHRIEYMVCQVKEAAESIILPEKAYVRSH